MSEPLLFDRRPPREMEEALAVGRPFHELIDLTTDPQLKDKAVDLHFRADPKGKNPYRATLYVGTSQVLQWGMRSLKRGERWETKLTPQDGPSFVNLARELFEPRWREWQPIEAIEEEWSSVSGYLHAAIAATPDERLGEGPVQRELGLGEPSLALIDREIVLSVIDGDTRRKLIPALTTQLTKAWQAMLADGYDWAKKPNRTTGKLDGLVADAQHRLLAIEVKSADADDVGTTPVQVAFYLLLLRAWIDQDEGKAHEALSGMISARHRLGLLDREYEIARPLQEHLKPVIALGGPMTDDQREKANFRMCTCVEYMAGAGLNLRDDIEVWWMPKLGGNWRGCSVGKLAEGGLATPDA